MFVSKQTYLPYGSPKKILHAAPEVFLSSRFQKIKNLEYLSADISNPGAMVQMYITDIRYPDNSFSVIYWLEGD